MTDKMGDPITLTTSDDPPVSLTVSRSALVTHSKVFADMLSLDLKSDNGNHSIPLAENGNQLKPFLSVIGHGEKEREVALSRLDENGWINLAKLADKYDCWAVRKSVGERAWELHVSKSNPKLAFALATICQNKKLIQATARAAVLVADLNLYPHISSEWRIRLALWKGAHLEKVMNALCEYAVRQPFHYPSNCSLEGCDGQRAWNRLVGLAFEHYSLDHSPPIPVQHELRQLSLCRDYIGRFEQQAAKFEKETSEWSPFPV